MRVGQAFNPFKLFTGSFIPEAIVRYRGLSPGAKLTYGRLARYAGENGSCYPSIPAVATEIGLSATQARKYVHELRDRRFITVEPRPGTSGLFTFLWHEAFGGEIGKKRKIPPLRKTRPLPLQKTEPPPLWKTVDEENHHQESQKKESQKPGEDSVEQIVGTTPQSVQLPKEKPKTFPLNADDKTPTSSRRLPLDNPEEEFKARISERHPFTEVQPEYVLKLVNEELCKCGLKLDAAFLEFEARLTTNPAALISPVGHYRRAVLKYNNLREAAVIENWRTPGPLVKPEKPSGTKCPHCFGEPGSGICLAEDGKGFVACPICSTPEFATKLIEKENAKRAARETRGQTQSGESAEEITSTCAA